MENGTYRLLYNQNLYLRAYANLYSNQGSLTPGVTDETADGMSLTRIDRIITALRYERYRWTPVRRVYIPKPDGRTRGLGLPTWSDKLLQEVLRLLLDAYYEPNFSKHSFGFRPKLGPTHALIHVHKAWTGIKWWIEGDIEGYFDNIDHEILLEILGRSIQDNRLLNLLSRYLAAGHMEDWRLTKNLRGVPQGGVLSPLLSNVYLHELDVFAEQELIPAHTRGEFRRKNPPYNRIQVRQHRLRSQGRYAEAEALKAEIRQLPSLDPFDPNFRRLRYVRYADDFLLGFSGPKQEALEIKSTLTGFLRDKLNLELNQAKTLVTHASSQPARFLGYDLKIQHANDQLRDGRRRLNRAVGFRIPHSTIEQYRRDYLRNGKPIPISMLVLESDYAIVSWYQSRLRGIYHYFALAYNVSWLHSLRYTMQTSLLKTLAQKHRSTLSRMWRKYRTTVYDTQGREYRCVAVTVPRNDGKPPLVARFGGFPLRRNPRAIIRDYIPTMYTARRSDLLRRLLADTCEVCEITGVPMEVHHIRALKDLYVEGQTPKAPWARQMAAMRRKTLVVCIPCHQDITHGRFDMNHA